jgi:membrane-associated phospholipid phosphatase
VLIGQLGRPWRRWVWTGLELAFYAAMWFAYDYSRGIADRLGMPLQVEMPRDIDRALFFGTDPNVWMQQQFFERDHVRWYDVAGSMIYYTHFIVPVAVAVILWVSNRRQWGRYVRRFATSLLVAVAGFILLPTVPPWMAASKKFPYDALPPLARPTTRGWAHLNFKTFVDWVIQGRDWANPTAAMPSLHAGFALLVPLFLMPFVRGRFATTLKVALGVFPVLMAATLVYFGEHYVADILGGWLVVAGSFLGWGWWEQRRAAAGRPDYGPLGRWLRRGLGEPETGLKPEDAIDASGRSLPQAI